MIVSSKYCRGCTTWQLFVYVFKQRTLTSVMKINLGKYNKQLFMDWLSTLTAIDVAASLGNKWEKKQSIYSNLVFVCITTITK